VKKTDALGRYTSGPRSRSRVAFADLTEFFKFVKLGMAGSMGLYLEAIVPGL